MKGKSVFEKFLNRHALCKRVVFFNGGRKSGMQDVFDRLIKTEEDIKKLTSGVEPSDWISNPEHDKSERLIDFWEMRKDFEPPLDFKRYKYIKENPLVEPEIDPSIHFIDEEDAKYRYNNRIGKITMKEKI